MVKLTLAQGNNVDSFVYIQSQGNEMEIFDKEIYPIFSKRSPMDPILLG